MKDTRSAALGVSAALLLFALAAPAFGAVACSATGEVQVLDNDRWTFFVTVDWDFHENARPVRFNLSLEHLDGCIHYDPDAPNQQRYIETRRGFTEADSTCVDVDQNPSHNVVLEGYVEMEDPDCWMPGRHLTWRNDGPTPDCVPKMAGSALLRFVSRGAPIGPTMYYDAITIVADDGTCVVCDYFGPMPDCNMWSPVESSTWGTVKALYR